MVKHLSQDLILSERSKNSPHLKRGDSPPRFLGAHMSVAGGVDKGLERAISIGCTAVQIFVKNNNQWFGKKLDPEEVQRFRKIQKESAIFVFAHAGYLINLASSNEENYKKSIASILDELNRCEELGIPFLVLHPGSHLGAGREEGLKIVVQSIRKIIAETKGFKVRISLETTAGQGNSLGSKFEDFQYILNEIATPHRLGVCFDTCHSYSAGYDIKSEEGYLATWNEFDKLIGIDNLLAFHLNDSMKEFNSHKDRHEHIGKGSLGTEAFSHLLNDKRFISKPMVLETPKGSDMKEDVINLELLKSLIK